LTGRFSLYFMKFKEKRLKRDRIQGFADHSEANEKFSLGCAE